MCNHDTLDLLYDMDYLMTPDNVEYMLKFSKSTLGLPVDRKIVWYVSGCCPEYRPYGNVTNMLQTLMECENHIKHCEFCKISSSFNVINVNALILDDKDSLNKCEL